jgi:hypothetical protein
VLFMTSAYILFLNPLVGAAPGTIRTHDNNFSHCSPQCCIGLPSSYQHLTALRYYYLALPQHSMLLAILQH